MNEKESFDLIICTSKGFWFAFPANQIYRLRNFNQESAPSLADLLISPNLNLKPWIIKNHERLLDFHPGRKIQSIRVEEPIIQKKFSTHDIHSLPLLLLLSRSANFNNLTVQGFTYYLNITDNILITILNN